MKSNKLRVTVNFGRIVSAVLCSILSSYLLQLPDLPWHTLMLAVTGPLIWRLADGNRCKRTFLFHTVVCTQDRNGDNLPGSHCSYSGKWLY
ncbi:hypothetical protein OKW38_001556 [Paraburkholderia sp. MM5496-R1]